MLFYKKQSRIRKNKIRRHFTGQDVVIEAALINYYSYSLYNTDYRTKQ